MTVTSVKTGSYNAVIGECVLCNPTSGGFTITLPTAVNQTGRIIEVKNLTASTNTITIATTSGQLIDGGATATITAGYVSLTFRSIGTGWVIV
jgi:hypothetical protein